MPSKKVKVKAWAVVDGSYIWATGYGHVEIHSEKKQATKRLKEVVPDGKVIPVLITYKL